MKALSNAKNVRTAAACILLFLSAVLILTFSGCSMEPVYYSQKEVMDYAGSIYGANDIKLIGKNVYNDDTDEQNPVYEYIFADSQGISFSVETYTYHVSIDASKTAFYERGIRDDYMEKKLEFHRSELDRLIKNCGIDYDSEFYYNSMELFLEDYTQIEKVSKLLEDIDSLVSLECSFDKWQSKEKYVYIYLFLKPDSGEEGWKEDYKFRFASVTLSNSSDERLSADEVKEELQWKLAENVKNGYDDIYTLPEEFLYRYPAGELKVTEVNGKALEKNMVFKYSFKEKTYWIYSLDPCQDFEELGYNYSCQGNFAELVRLLGGSYRSDKLKAQWSIGNHQWNGILALDSEKNYIGFIAMRDGQILTLSNPEEKSNGSVSGRAFTMEDVEQLLGVEITEDQAARTCQLNLTDD